jgi:predicted GH43/DUF377 family glycosyl hydrolase
MIGPEDLQPTREDMEIIGIFNPGAVLHGQEVVILARVAEKPKEHRWGYVAIPRWEEGALHIDWYEEDEVEQIDPRWVRRRKDGIVLLTNTAHLRVLRSKDGRTIDSTDGAPARQGESLPGPASGLQTERACPASSRQ